MTRLSVFIASSVDGYIATRDGSLEWLDDAAEGGHDDYGYAAFIDTVDALALGLHRVYVDGGNLIGGFLAEGLIDDMVLTTAPVLLGDGLALFPPGPRSRKLALVDTRSWPNGFVSRSYELRAASNG